MALAMFWGSLGVIFVCLGGVLEALWVLLGGSWELQVAPPATLITILWLSYITKVAFNQLREVKVGASSCFLLLLLRRSCCLSHL